MSAASSSVRVLERRRRLERVLAGAGQNLVNLYALVSRMRILSSPQIVESADRVAHVIVDTYLAPNRTLRDVRDHWATTRWMYCCSSAMRAAMNCRWGGRGDVHRIKTKTPHLSTSVGPRVLAAGAHEGLEPDEEAAIDVAAPPRARGNACARASRNSLTAAGSNRRLGHTM